MAKRSPETKERQYWPLIENQRIPHSMEHNADMLDKTEDISFQIHIETSTLPKRLMRNARSWDAPETEYLDHRDI